MLLFHEVCHSSKIYLSTDGLKLVNGILKEVGSNESHILLPIQHFIISDAYVTRDPTENNFCIIAKNS